MQRTRTNRRIARWTATVLIGALVPMMAATMSPAAAAVTQGIVGTVTESGTGTPLPGTWVLAMSSTSFDLVKGTIADGTGAYELDLPVGDYRVEFVEPSSSHDVEWYNGQGFDHPEDAAILTVVADETITANAALDLPTGTVSGTITEQGTGTPIPNAWVAAMNTSGQPLATVQANGAGAYSIPAVETGVYRIAGIDPAGAHALSISPDSPTFDGATPVTITPGGSVTANVALPTKTTTPATSTITGTVTDDISGLPVPGLWVVALTASSFELTAGGLTDSSGNYSLAVPNGDYYVEFFDPTRAHRFEWYGNQDNPGTIVELVEVPSGGVANAAVAPLQGDIAGTITADADGQPVAGAWVFATGATDGQPVAGVVADALGNYRLPALSVGDYVIAIADRTGVHQIEYSGNAASPGTAVAITVTGGNTTTMNAGLA